MPEETRRGSIFLMSTSPNNPDSADHNSTDDAVQVLRASLRKDLVAAMKSRDKETVSALRTAIAAIDNAEAVAVEDVSSSSSQVGEHVAGAASGVGATEVSRRELSLPDVREVLAGQIAERRTEAEGYDSLGQFDAAARLRREADVLAAYIDGQ